MNNMVTPILANQLDKVVMTDTEVLHRDPDPSSVAMVAMIKRTKIKEEACPCQVADTQATQASLGRDLRSVEDSTRTQACMHNRSKLVNKTVMQEPSAGEVKDIA